MKDTGWKIAKMVIRADEVDAINPVAAVLVISVVITHICFRRELPARGPRVSPVCRDHEIRPLVVSADEVVHPSLSREIVEYVVWKLTPPGRSFFQSKTFSGPPCASVIQSVV